MTTLYESDFYAWCVEQAENLKSGKIDKLDLKHLSEEIDCLGKQWRRQLVSRLEILFLHLLKWHYSSSDVREWHKNSWIKSINCQKNEIPFFLRKHPSLKATLDEDIEEAYERGRFQAHLEGNIVLEDMPISCPFALEDALTPGWLPRDRY